MNWKQLQTNHRRGSRGMWERGGWVATELYKLNWLCASLRVLRTHGKRRRLRWANHHKGAAAAAEAGPAVIYLPLTTMWHGRLPTHPPSPPCLARSRPQTHTHTQIETKLCDCCWHDSCNNETKAQQQQQQQSKQQQQFVVENLDAVVNRQ